MRIEYAYAASFCHLDTVDTVYLHITFFMCMIESEVKCVIFLHVHRHVW